MLQRDKEGAKKAPEILKDQTNPTPKGSRSYSTSAVRRGQLMISPASKIADPSQYIFELPELPLPPHSNLKHRYPPIVDRVSRLIMRDGKLARAQSNVSRILNHLRTAPPPRINPARPLVPDAPPASHLPLNPVEYLTCAIDSIAPLIQMKSIKGMAGGGRTLPVPVPLAVWQRRRRAVMWILETVEKKRSRGSGHGMFATKIAEELIAIVEGRSSLWERRQTLHKLGTTARANVVKFTSRRK
jgi:small subunit ribosomal protein S7